MSPEQLVLLVRDALGRKPTVLDLRDWGAVLAPVSDDDGWAALLAVRSTSPHHPAPSDLRKAATAIANDRSMRAEADRLRHERETHTTLDGRPLVPMPPAVRDGLRELQRRQAARDAALASEDQPC